MLASPSVKHCSYLHRSLGQLEGLYETIHILLLAHSLAHHSHSVNIYYLPPAQLIYFTLSTSGPKLTIAKSTAVGVMAPAVWEIFLVAWE